MKGNENKEIYIKLLNTLEEEKKALLQIKENKVLELHEIENTLISLSQNIEETRAKIESPFLSKFRQVANKIKTTINEKTEQVEQVISNKNEKSFTDEIKELGSNLNDRFNQATESIKKNLPIISGVLKEKAITIKDSFTENVNSYKKEILKGSTNSNQVIEPWPFPTSSEKNSEQNDTNSDKVEDFSKYSKKEMLALWVTSSGVIIDNKSKQDLDTLYDMYSSFVNEEQRYNKNYFYQGLSNVETLSGLNKKLDNKTKKYLVNISFSN